MRKLSKNNFIIILSSVLIIGLSLFFYFRKTSNLNWSAKQVGDSEVDVYLQGDGAQKVSGVDLKVAFDNSTIHITSTDFGDFLVNPLTVKVDNNSQQYSLITNPLEKSLSNPDKPVLKFHITPNKLKDIKFSILPTSQVYITNVGGNYPKPFSLILK